MGNLVTTLLRTPIPGSQAFCGELRIPPALDVKASILAQGGTEPTEAEQPESSYLSVEVQEATGAVDIVEWGKGVNWAINAHGVEPQGPTASHQEPVW